MSGSAAKPDRYVTLFVIALVGLGMALGGGALLLWSASNTYNFKYRLSKDPVKAKAQVSDWRTVTRRKSGTTYDVRYSFAVPGDDATYSPVEGFLITKDTDIWYSLPEDVWKRSQDTGTIDIEYLKSDPEVNQPVKAKHGFGSIALFAVMGLILFALGALFLNGGIRQLVKRYRYVPELLESP